MASFALFTLFTAAAVLALAILALSVRRHAGQALALRQQLRECPSAIELRWTVREHVRRQRGATVLRGDFRAAAGRRAATPALRAAA